ncbi:MAG: hypothetical protein ACO3F5_02265 [Gemmatimonadaceae bacterium]
MTIPLSQPSEPTGDVIAGSVLPLRDAEALIATLQDVTSVRITATPTGGIEAVHVLVSGVTPAKQHVRNIESALMARLGLKVDHRKISIAATASRPAGDASATVLPPSPTSVQVPGRHVYFEDVEIRGSRARGVTCRVTLRVGGESYAGEAEEGVPSDRNRVEVAARAAVAALGLAVTARGVLALEGARVLSMFDREFVFVGLVVREGREQKMFTGTCEVRDSVETAAVLAVLDATNRWSGQSDEVSPFGLRN